MTFAEKVKYVRKMLNYSQEKLASVLDVAFSTVNRWENGHAMPRYEVQEKFNALCKANNINFE